MTNCGDGSWRLHHQKLVGIGANLHMRREWRCGSADGNEIGRDIRQELKYIIAVCHDPVPRALIVSTETITLSRAIRYGGFEFSLFFGLPLPIVGQVVDGCRIVACFCARTTGMIGFPMALCQR